MMEKLFRSDFAIQTKGEEVSSLIKGIQEVLEGFAGRRATFEESIGGSTVCRAGVVVNENL